MTIREDYAHGEFCWVDLASLEMEGAMKFYGALFGWEAKKQDTGGGPPYAMFYKGDKVVAGLGELNDEMKSQGVPPVWNNYVNVDDAAATQAKVEELGGGVVVPAMDVMGAGWLAFFSDPGGAVFAVWQKNAHGGAELVNEPGAFCWNELATKDLEQTKPFYAGVFGWEFSDLPGPDGPVPTAMIQNQERANGHMLQMNEKWEGIPPHWMAYFAVDDTDASAAKVAELGGKVMVPPTDIPPGRFSVVSDPQGAVFTVLKLNYAE